MRPVTRDTSHILTVRGQRLRKSAFDDYITKTVLIAKNTGIPCETTFGLIVTGSFQADRNMFCLHGSSDQDSSSSGRPSPPSCGLACPPSETFLGTINSSPSSSGDISMSARASLRVIHGPPVDVDMIFACSSNEPRSIDSTFSFTNWSSGASKSGNTNRSEEHTSELQSRG